MHAKSAKPLYQKIADDIHASIVAGRYPDGKLPSETMLVRRFSTTRTTVAHAIDELVRMGIAVRKPGSGTFVKPVPDGKGRFVATLIAGLGDTDFFGPVCAQIARACRPHGLNLVWGPTNPATVFSARSSIDHVVGNFVREGISGVFFAPDEDKGDGEAEKRNERVAAALTAAGIAVVLLDRDVVRYPRQGPYDFVGIDNMAAGCRQTAHLIERGCRRICYVTRPGRLGTMEGRIAGFRSALADAGLQPAGDGVYAGDVDDPKFCRRILRARPDGIVCFHDQIAAPLLQRLVELKVKVPEKVKVVGLDDVDYARYLAIPLTTLRQPREAFGDQAASLMALRLNNERHPPRRVLYDTELVVRKST